MTARAASRPRTVQLGCDLGGTNVKVAVLRGARVHAERSCPVGVRDAASLLSLIADETRAALAAAAPSGRGGGVTLGVAVPGFLDAARRRVVELSNLPCLDGVPLAARLERRLRRVLGERRVVLDADTNAGAVAEARLGAGRRASRVLFAALGTGLGAAFVVDGEPVRASRHTIGQIAHLPLGSAGPRCTCGRRGCAEALLAAKGLRWRAQRAGLGGRVATSPAELDAAARAGSRDVRRVWREHGVALGDLLATLVNLLSPEVVVIGGGIAGAAELFLPAAVERLSTRVPPRLRATRVVAASLGPGAAAIGAALLGAGGAR